MKNPKWYSIAFLVALWSSNAGGQSRHGLLHLEVDSSTAKVGATLANPAAGSPSAPFALLCANVRRGQGRPDSSGGSGASNAGTGSKGDESNDTEGSQRAAHILRVSTVFEGEVDRTLSAPAVSSNLISVGW
jgi:hypothetical protein